MNSRVKQRVREMLIRKRPDPLEIAIREKLGASIPSDPVEAADFLISAQAELAYLFARSQEMSETMVLLAGAITFKLLMERAREEGREEALRAQGSTEPLLKGL